MSTKSREVIWGGRIMGAEIRAQGARQAAQKASGTVAASSASDQAVLVGGLPETDCGVSAILADKDYGHHTQIDTGCDLSGLGVIQIHSGAV